jgi:hypothetical protein
MNKQLLFMYVNFSGENHVTNSPTAFSTMGLDPVYRVGNLLHGVQHTRGRSAQPDRRRFLSAGLFYFSGTVAAAARRQPSRSRA